MPGVETACSTDALLHESCESRYPCCALQVGERLGRYEVEKRCAVEKEDYDLAKEKKQQMARYRAQVYEQLELHGLLQGEQEVRAGHGMGHMGGREGLSGLCSAP